MLASYSTCCMMIYHYEYCYSCILQSWYYIIPDFDILSTYHVNVFARRNWQNMFVISTNISQPRTFTTYWWALFRKIQSTAADDFFLPLLSGSRKNLPKNFSICIKMTGIINHHQDQITLGKSSVISHVCWFRHHFSWKLL